MPIYTKISGLRKPLIYEINSKGCWICTSHCKDAPYTTIHRNKYLHRLVYELEKEPIRQGNVVMHLCDTPKCFNPEHLKQGTQFENTRDRDLKGRWVEHDGEKNPRAKLTEEKVKEIWLRIKSEGKGEHTYEDLAKTYGVAKSTISNIANGFLWRRVTGL